VNDNFEGKIAVVTGAAQGIGLAIATKLAAGGATVVLSDINEEAVNAAAAGIEGAEAVVTDVRSEDAVGALINGAAERHGKLDIVVPNAGVGRVVQPIVEMSYADWRETVDVNLDGVFLAARDAARVMAGQGSGSIVNIASITGHAGAAGIAAYGAAKAAVINLTKTLNTEMREYGIRVNCVCPAFIKTQLVNDAEAQFDALLPEGITLEMVIQQKQDRWGTPEDVANAVCFLAGDRTPWISGWDYTIDGGWEASLL
jgi:NAD(P)-dependent dehydrogenase (short-subunit alcohol dehydrogenase family)